MVDAGKTKEEIEYEMFLDVEDCEHGLPGWDQCDACIAIYEDWAEDQ